MSWDAVPTGRRGRHQIYSDSAIQTDLSMKVLFGMALRQTTGVVESLLGLVGLGWTLPDFSTLSRRQKPLAVNIPYRGSKGPLHLLIPSRPLLRNILPGSGQHRHQGRGERRVACAQASLPSKLRFDCRPAGGPKRRVWRKIHLGIDEHALEVRAVRCRQVIAWQPPRGRSPGAASATRRSCPTFSAGSRKSRRSAASRQTAPTTSENATMRSPTATLMPSSRPDCTPGQAGASWRKVVGSGICSSLPCRGPPVRLSFGQFALGCWLALRGGAKGKATGHSRRPETPSARGVASPGRGGFDR